MYTNILHSHVEYLPSEPRTGRKEQLADADALRQVANVYIYTDIYIYTYVYIYIYMYVYICIYTYI